jgi:hypothetical protein
LRERFSMHAQQALTAATASPSPSPQAPHRCMKQNE